MYISYENYRYARKSFIFRTKFTDLHPHKNNKYVKNEILYLCNTSLFHFAIHVTSLLFLYGLF